MIEKRSVKHAGPVHSTKIAPQIAGPQSKTPQPGSFDHKMIRSALRLLNALEELGRHPLADLNAVKVQCGDSFTDDLVRRGSALREVLYLAIEELRPGDGPINALERAWFPYFIVTRQYLEKRSATLLAQRMCVGRTVYFEEQKCALDLLVGALQQVEQRSSKVLAARDTAPPFLAPPRPVHSLVGREPLLNELKWRLFAGQSSALNGIPGAGKTALAIELAHSPEVIEYFQNGILWAGLGRHPDVLTLLSMWGTALNIPPNKMSRLDTVEERARRIHDAIGLRRILLVIDDAWQAETALAFKVGGPNCAALLTTRIPEVALAFASDGVIPVSELSEDDSVALLGQMAPQALSDEPGEVRALARAVGGLPLALTLMGWHLRKETHTGQPRRLQRSLEQLRQARTRMLITQPQTALERRPDVSAEMPHSLQTIIKISDETLNDEAQQALRALSALPPKPNTFSEAAALAVSAAAEMVLDTLVEHGLLEVNRAGRYTLHQTIADYAALELARDPVAQRCARERMVNFFVGYIDTHTKDFQALEAENNNLITTLDMAFQEGMAIALVNGTNTLSQFLLNSRPSALGDIYLKRAEKVARELGDAKILMKTLRRSAYVKRRIGKLEEAKTLLDEVMTTAQAVGDRSDMIFALAAMGDWAYIYGDYIRARESLYQGLALAQESKQPDASLLTSLGIACYDSGQAREGISYLEQALIEHRREGDRSRESLCLSNLSSIYQQNGYTEKAFDYSQQAQRIAREIGGRKYEGNALCNLGCISHEMGNIRQALEQLQQALIITRALGDPRHEFFIIGHSANCYMSEGQMKQALEYYQQCLDIARKNNFRGLEGEGLGKLGRAYRELGEAERAREYTEQALAIAQEVGDRLNASIHLSTLGKLCHDQGQIQESAGCPGAIGYYQQALELARAISNPIRTGEYLHLLGKAYHNLGQDETAAEYFRQTLTALEGVTSPLAARMRGGDCAVGSRTVKGKFVNSYTQSPRECAEIPGRTTIQKNTRRRNSGGCNRRNHLLFPEEVFFFAALNSCNVQSKTISRCIQ